MTTPPFSRAGIPRSLLLVALVIGGVAVWLGMRRFDRWRYPWADTTSGHPALLGTWVGQLTTGGRRPRAVLMSLQRETVERTTSSSRCRGCDDGVEGSGLTCDERGRVWRYRVSGTPEDRRATRMTIGLQPVETPPPDGLSLSVTRGGWDGADALHLEAEFYWRRGESAISSTADPDTKGWVPLPMRRGTEADFRALCSPIRGPAIPEVVP